MESGPTEPEVRADRDVRTKWAGRKCGSVESAGPAGRAKPVGRVYGGWFGPTPTVAVAKPNIIGKDGVC